METSTFGLKKNQILEYGDCFWCENDQSKTVKQTKKGKEEVWCTSKTTLIANGNEPISSNFRSFAC